MNRARLTGAILLTALMLISMLPVFTAGVSEAATGVTLQAYPNKIVPGQYVMFTIKQTSGTFVAGANLYVMVKETDTWTSANSNLGIFWQSLPAGKETLPQGSVLVLPPNDLYTGYSFHNSTTLADAAAPGDTGYILITDSFDASTGVFSAPITIDRSELPPYISVNGGSPNPYDYVSINYDPFNPAEFSVSPAIIRISPGDTVVLYYYVPGDTVTFYLDYYGGTRLATASGGSGVVTFTMPDTTMGLHAIVAVSNTGYGAFNWIWVDPIIIPNKISIAGEVGDKITFTGRGFPAGAQVNGTWLYETDTLALVADSTAGELTITSGTADSQGRITFTIELQKNLLNSGLYDVRIQLTIGPSTAGTFNYYEGERGATDAPFRHYRGVFAVSTPAYYADEILYAGTTATISTPVGSYIPVAVANFPAYTRVEVYVGPALAGTITTDANGAGIAYVRVPVLPGFFNNGTQIQYPLYAKATTSLGTLIAYGTGTVTYTVQIEPSVSVYVADTPVAVSATLLDYLKSGLNTIAVEITGLSPYATVNVYESYENAGWATVLILQGTADANGVFSATYTVNYDSNLALLGFAASTGKKVNITVEAYPTASTTPIYETAIGDSEYTYLQIGSIALDTIALIDPRISTLTDIDRVTGPISGITYYAVSPGDYIEVNVTGLIDTQRYALYLNGAPVTIYDGNDVRRAYIIATEDSDGDGLNDKATVRFYVPNSRSVIGLNTLEIRPVSNSALEPQTILTFVGSDPLTARYGTAQVLPWTRTVTPGAVLAIIGVNFEGGETVSGGIAGVATATVAGTATDRGFVVAEVVVPPVPAGDYVVYLQRTSDNQTFAGTVTVVPGATAAGVLTTLEKAVGEPIEFNATGLEPLKAYAFLWTEEMGGTGRLITANPDGSGAVLTFFTNANGTLNATFPTPFGIIGEDYYVYLYDPATGQVVSGIDPVKVIIQAPRNFTEEWAFNITPLAAMPTQEITITLYNATNFTVGLADPVDNPNLNSSIVLADILNVYVRLVYPDGTSDFVKAVLHAAGSDLHISFVMPNSNYTMPGEVQLTLFFQATVLSDNGSLVNVNETINGVLPFGSIYYVPGGGAVLAGLVGQIADLLVPIDNKVTQIQATLDDLAPVILAINDTVVMINTTLGMVYADLEDVKQLLGDVNASVVSYGDQILVALNSSSGQVLASLNAIAELIDNSTLAIRGDLAVINTTLGQISIDVSNLALLLQGLGDTVVAKLDENLNLTRIAVMQGNETIMLLEGLNVTLSQLQPLVTDLQDGVATLQTLVGTLQTSINDLAQGQVEIKNLIQTSTGDIIAVVDTGVTTLNATLNAAVEMLQEGIATAQDNVLAQLASVNATLAAAVSDVKAAVDNGFQTLGAAVDQAKTELADQIGAVQADVTTVKADVADVKTTLADVSTQLTNVNNRLNDVATKDDVSGAKDELAGKIDQLAQTVQDQTSQAASKAQTWGMINLVVGIVILALAGYLLVQVRQQAS